MSNYINDEQTLQLFKVRGSVKNFSEFTTILSRVTELLLNILCLYIISYLNKESSVLPFLFLAKIV